MKIPAKKGRNLQETQVPATYNGFSRRISCGHLEESKFSSLTATR
jgi:hypothetical protein